MLGVILTGLPDILDGSVARTSGRATPRGAFFDSVCDRVADAAIFCGVAWYLADESARLPVLVLAVLALSMLITYERARAESLGFVARGGLMERAERMVLLGDRPRVRHPGARSSGSCSCSPRSPRCSAS